MALATTVSACGSSGSSSGSTSASASSFNAGVTSIVNQSSKTGGTLRYALTSDWDSPDPGNTYYAFSWDFSRLYGRSLLAYERVPGSTGLNLQGDLAKSWSVSPDGLTWTFNLQQGVKYQDGQEVTAADVKYAVERSNWGQDTLSNGPSYFKSLVVDKTNYQGPYKDTNPNDGVSGIEVDGSYTIKFHLTQPFADFGYLATLPDTMPVPRAKDTGATYYKAIQSTGQYEIESYTPGKNMTLVPNPEFDATTDPNHQHTVTASKITVSLDMTQDQIDQDLLHGSLDGDLDGTGVGTTAQAEILSNPTLKKQADDSYTGALTYMTINTKVAPFDQVSCRQAVEYAVNKVTVQNALGGSVGGGDIASTVLPPSVAGYQASNQYSTPGDTGSVDKAKQLLATCKTAEPSAFNSDGSLNVNLSARSDRPKEINSAVAIQAALAKVGINVTIDKFTSDKYFGSFAGNPTYTEDNKIGLSMMKWGADWQDGYGFMDQVVTSAGIHAGGGSTNLGLYDDPAVDALFTKALATTDATARTAIWTQIDQKVMSDAAIVPLVYNKALVFHPTQVTNWYEETAFGMPDFSILGTTNN
ncbi:ABC transporter substrate-binding protein [Actinospica durhamensis]|uniref:ABC transporter substrate-binding protein n=1 Tax=Actinospica durhamensis TaxID=1508375 RepID=A0A941EQ59_9ACTN|nr:ABC transporter substrate-binding protein [Actinospica durhamensis]MBR7835336.1 ABC transporter substrate-binding protein [Actinospica durhamensis]